MIFDAVKNPMTMREWKQRHIKPRKKRRTQRLPQKPFSLYVLLLEDDCFYVGITRNMEQRYEKHCEGSGAAWTKRHKPIGIIEIQDSLIKRESAMCKVENLVTLEYASIYGYDRVRGGRYCQRFPRWPKQT